MRHLYLGHDEKAAIAHHLVEVLTALRLCPTNRAIARTHPPRRTTEGHCPEVTRSGAVNEVAQLRPTQRTRPQPVVALHQRAPHLPLSATRIANEHQLHRPQCAQ